MAKSEATAMARETCQLARECMGGNGIQIENQAMKHLCDIEAIHTYEGTHQINSLVAGREMTGLAAFK
jgi:alkylation response protein AidB-like acyl-CoA dehydrogenase